jgi:tetratricopeptide (TPR) repeat protein
VKLASLYFDEKDWAKAEEYSKRAIETDPDYYEGYRRLSKTYRFQARYGEALAICQKALERPAIRKDQKAKNKIEEELQRVKDAQEADKKAEAEGGEEEAESKKDNDTATE